MNLAIRGIEGYLGDELADSFRADLHPDLKAGLVPSRKDLASPPFNMSDWDGENRWEDVRSFSFSASNGERVGIRCRIRSSPVNSANLRLSPVGVAGFVMANGSMSTQTSNEGEIRKALIEADLVDCMVELSGQQVETDGNLMKV